MPEVAKVQKIFASYKQPAVVKSKHFQPSWPHEPQLTGRNPLQFIPAAIMDSRK